MYFWQLIICLLCSWEPNHSYTEEGLASYYASHFQDKMTANGELYDSTMYTAAHKELPFGQMVLVIRQDNGKSVKVRINDRGPFVDRRIIDLSKAAARELGMVREGIVPVTVRLIEKS